MDDVTRAQDLIGTNVYDREGTRIGRVGNVYVDDATRQPEWITVRLGLLGTRESFVPLSGASTGEDRLNVSVLRERVKGAPRVGTERGYLSDEEGRDLYVHYGIERNPPRPDTAAESEAEPESPDLPAPGRHAQWHTGPPKPRADEPATDDQPIQNQGGRHRRED